MNWARGAVASSYPAVPELLQDLQIGRIDAAVIDAPVAAYLMARIPASPRLSKWQCARRMRGVPGCLFRGILAHPANGILY
jgi:hypothetical protein